LRFLAAIQAKVLHIFSAGNFARVALERLGTHEHFEAEVPRERLRELALEPGHTVTASFRHIRLFGGNRFVKESSHLDIHT
jgi:hypothetical protein